jgi:subtilase family serine protease
VTVPSTIALGNYYLLACADDKNVVAEANETNNCIASKTTVQVIGTDYIETWVSNPPATGALGSSFSVGDTAKNQGNVSATKSSYTRYYLSINTVRNSTDRLLTGSRQVPALTPGTTSNGTVAVTVPSAVSLGIYYLLACADDTKLVIESNEKNNCISSSSTVQVVAPDLIETSVTDPPPSSKPGNTFSVTDTAKNQGNADSGASQTRYYLSTDKITSTTDKLLTGSRSVSALTPGSTDGGTVTVTIPTGTTLGSYYLLACADDTNLVIESNEHNNCKASINKVQITQ